MGLVMLLAAGVWLGSMSLLASDQDHQLGGFDTGDVYLMIGEQGAWLGNRIHYTVYEKTTVEARFITMSGEIIILLPLGEQEPGQYLLPWHTTPEAVAMAGLYKFELYFGDEYAVNSHIAVFPGVRKAL